MLGCKGLKEKLFGQRRALELHGDDVHRAARVDALAPRRLASSVEWDDEIGCQRAVVGIHMRLDLQPVRAMIARLVRHTCRLVTRNNRRSRLKKKPVALVNSCSPNNVATRVTESKSDSITIDLPVFLTLKDGDKCKSNTHQEAGNTVPLRQWKFCNA